MFECPVVFVDIETTGGSYRNSRVLEIAAIRVEHGVVVREFNTLLNPEAYIPANITALTGIKATDIQHKPVFLDIAHELQDILSDAIFIAHNVRFDYSFIKQEFAQIDIDFSPKLLCTVRLSRALYATHQGHSLAALIERHKIPVHARHRALHDARAIQYFVELAFREHGPELFSAAVAQQLKTQSLPAHLDAAKVYAIENVPGVYIFKDEAQAPLYVGKSVALKKRVMSHFQSTHHRELKISHQVHHIETIKTNSELGALLLESKLIKELQPIYNRLLRRTSRYAMLVKSDQHNYATLEVKIGTINKDSDVSKIYGLYRGRMHAKRRVTEITRTFSLCPKLMGIEKAKNACFYYSLGKCKGACIGQEAPELYNQRFETALEYSKVALWDYPSAVSVPINEQGERVIINNWIIEGFLNKKGKMSAYIEPNFDIDEYKIIRRFLQQNQHLIQPF